MYFSCLPKRSSEWRQAVPSVKLLLSFSHFASLTPLLSKHSVSFSLSVGPSSNRLMRRLHALHFALCVPPARGSVTSVALSRHCVQASLHCAVLYTVASNIAGIHKPCLFHILLVMMTNALALLSRKNWRDKTQGVLK